MENEIKRGRKKKEIDGNFAKLLSELLQNVKTEKGTIQDDVAKAIGVSRQALGKWANGETVPDIIDFKKLAIYFDVSADYLLGLTNNKTNNITVKAICEYTGLSDEAVESLADYIDPEYSYDPAITSKEEQEMQLKTALNDVNVRNDFIASDWFWDIVGLISRLNILSEQWEKTVINEIHAEIKGDNADCFYEKSYELSKECDVVRYLITQKINEYINFYDNRIDEEHERTFWEYKRKDQLKEKILKEAADNGEHNPPKE